MKRTLLGACLLSIAVLVAFQIAHAQSYDILMVLKDSTGTTINPGGSISTSPGGSTLVRATFNDTGQYQLHVTGIKLVADFGNSTFQGSALPLSLSPGDSKSLTLNMTVPATESIGSHNSSLVVNWEGYVTNQWVSGQSLVFHFYFQVQSSKTITPPQNTVIDWTQALGYLAGAAAFIIVIAVVLSRYRKQRPPETVGPPPVVVPPVGGVGGFCPNCGSPVDVGAMFCPNCGTRTSVV